MPAHVQSVCPPGRRSSVSCGSQSGLIVAALVGAGLMDSVKREEGAAGPRVRERWEGERGRKTRFALQCFCLFWI